MLSCEFDGLRFVTLFVGNSEEVCVGPCVGNLLGDFDGMSFGVEGTNGTNFGLFFDIVTEPHSFTIILVQF